MKSQPCTFAPLALVVLFALSACDGSKDGAKADTTPPTVVSTSPASGAQRAQVTAIRATFSEGLDAGTIGAASFALVRGPAPGTPVPGAVSYDAATSTAVFTPTGGRLDYATTYTATVSTAVRDVAGNAMASAHAWTFTTKTNLAVQAGLDYNVALQDDGTVWSWGENTTWGMGRDIGLVQSDPVPARDALPTTWPVKLLATGEGHTLAVDAAGGVFAWGRNFYGELGDGTTTHRMTAVRVGLPALPAGVTVTAIAAGTFHSLLLASDGSVYAWGRNGVGELGDGTTTDRTSPSKVPGLAGVTAIAAGFDSLSMGFSLARKSDGTVWGWGSNLSYELAHDVAASACGAECFDFATSPHPLHALGGVTSIAAGYAFGVAVNASGSVLSWGWNAVGVLGNGTCGSTSTFVPTLAMVSAAAPTTPFSGVASVVAGRMGGASEAYVLARKSDGTVWGWGNNTFGVLGDGTTGVTVNCQGFPGTPNLRIYPVQATGLADVVGLSTGNSHSLALKADGTVWAWGGNGNRILGLDPAVTADPVLTPTKVPNF